MSRTIAAAATVALCLLGIGTAAAQATTRERSTTDRLQDRRYVAAGDRAQVLGFEDGRFYANGWHIAGEMGGIWSQPLKLLDGVWFGVDGKWVGPATRFTSGRGYVRMDLPDTAGLRLRRTDFVPRGRRAALLGLRIANPGASARTVRVTVDAHSELETSFPWTSTTPSADDDLADTASFDGDALVFRDDGTPPYANATEHHYAALVGSTAAPASGETGGSANGYRGPQGTNVCTAQEAPSACDDGPAGHGAGGELTYAVRVPAHGARRLWVAVAGSDEGLAAARGELAGALRDPGRELADKVAARARLARRTRLSLPGDPRLAEAIDWGKQNLADLTQTARDLHIRYTNQGKEYPPPKGTVARASWVGAGFPDYPWIFATDAEYTTFAAAAVGQFEPMMDHLRTLRDVSDIVNDGSGKVAHEIVPDGSVYYGANSDPGNTDETVKFPSAVALLWRWSGDDAFRDEMYAFATRNLHYVVDHLDADGDGWPEGLGNVEREGMGPEKLDNTVYLIRGLYDLADMARSKHDRATAAWAGGLARDLRRRFDGTWWLDDQSLYADSLGDANEPIEQRHWITETPMSVELTGHGRAIPGLAPYAHGARSLALHETDCYSGTRPYNRGLFHTACGGGPEGAGERTIFTLTTAIQSIAEGNYGRLGSDRQQRYTDANAETMLGEPWTGGTPDEQPGALPEIVPSPDFDGGDAPNDANIDRCWNCRAMFMQAWGNYGTAWAVVHQQLGMRPDLGRGRLTVVPQVPASGPVAGRRIRLGDGWADVAAAHPAQARWTTEVTTRSRAVRRLRVGHTLPRGARVRWVRLDGRKVRWRQRTTNRGVEVTVRATPGHHRLEVRGV